MDIHLDLIGGLAGDMFIAAMVDAMPRLEERVHQAILTISHLASVSTGFVQHRDDVLVGRRFQVCRAQDQTGAPERVLLGEPAHLHTTWRSIKNDLEESALDHMTRAHALGIFSLLAAAEAAVHGVAVEEVTFHEVGAWDSVADIVGAAALIAAVDARHWTSSPAPLGSGRITTAHGMLPLPAPATTRLLLGMRTLDDGIAGERVTPTGAAILRYLCGPEQTSIKSVAQARTLVASGNGFGTQQLRGLSNHVRVLCFGPSEISVLEHRALHIVEFDVDDQAGEELAVGLDRLRQSPAVLDVTQAPVMGKKNRLATHVRILVRGDHLNAAIEGCFRETTTIGLRHYPAQGIALKRHTTVVDVEGHSMRVKVVERPGGLTAKAESDDVLEHRDHRSRATLRRRAEALALAIQPVTLDA